MITEQFESDILDALYDTYTVNGETVTGQSLSFTQECLRDEGWRGISDIHELEREIIEAGFTVAAGRNSRGQKCRVVYL